MKFALLSLIAGCTLLGTTATAQCPAGRYNSELFSTVTTTTVTYSDVYNLQMNVYQPDGDTYPNRPVMILAHGGSFIGGDKDADATVNELCERFAKRGYVTASINYRLGNLFSMASDSVEAINTVIKAISDGKAAVRFFVKDAATTNTYHVDTNNIFVGGNSAGAVLYMHVGYLSSIDECPPHIATSMAANGGFEGNSGNDGYTTKTKAVINLAGALNSTSFVNLWDKPSVNAHGTADNTVPYNCGWPLSGVVHVTLCGLGALEPVYTANSVYHYSKIYEGADHVPWSSDAAMFNSVDSMTEEFCYNLICTGAAGVKEAHASTEVQIYPNPAGKSANIHTASPMRSVAILDPTGRIVLMADGVDNTSYNINTAILIPGNYIVRTTFRDSNLLPVVKKLTIQ